MHQINIHITMYDITAKDQYYNISYNVKNGKNINIIVQIRNDKYYENIYIFFYNFVPSWKYCKSPIINIK